MMMKTSNATSLSDPRFETVGKLSIVGISRHYRFGDLGEIPDQWQSFVPLMARVTSEPKPTTYGVIYNGDDDGVDYLSGIELPRGSETPGNLVRLDMAPQRYAVFEHPGHVATVRDTCSAIWSTWLPTSGVDVVEAPWFERYGARFDPITGAGGLEIWIPVSA
jgi:AraC family transcriptional regulator